MAHTWRGSTVSGAASGEGAYAAEVARLRASGVLGESGRLRELFDFLADRGPAAASASQAEIADSVFGQADTEGDDATVRVYIHRLRKRLDEFYAGEAEGGPRVVLPAGTYALRLAEGTGDAPAAPAPAPGRTRWLYALALGAVAAAFLLGWALSGGGSAPRVNAFWQPFVESDRPIVVVVGDYYMFGEVDPVRPEQSRLIRDYRIDSPMDLAALQEAEPARYGNAEDVGLTYLPISTSYGLQALLPVLARDGREVTIVPASEFEADSARGANVVYIGLLAAMRLLEDRTFAGSGFALGESYDELIDRTARRTYTSDEFRSLASPVAYRDYAFVARFEDPGGSLVAVIAAARDTALRGVAPVIAGEELPDELADLADNNEGLEALFQVTGQQGADLSERLIVARERR